VRKAIQQGDGNIVVSPTKENIGENIELSEGV